MAMFGYSPRVERANTLGALGMKSRPTSPTGTLDPTMGVGSATNPNLAPYAGNGDTPTVPTSYNATPTQNIIGTGNGGFHRAGYNGPTVSHAFTPEQQAQIDRNVGLASSLYGSDPFAAARVLGAAGGNSTAQDTAFAAKHFGGDMAAYKSWLQSQLQQSGTYSFDQASGSVYGTNGELIAGPGRAPIGGGQAGSQAGGQAGGQIGGQGVAQPSTLGGLAGSAGSPGYGVNVSDFLDPSMQFRMDQGMRALENSAAGRGSLMSGDTLRGIQDYAQGLASTEYGNAWNRAANNRDFNYGVDAADRAFDYNANFQDRAFDYGRQRDLAQFGLQAAGQQQSSDNTLAGILASIIQNGGQIAGTGTIGQSNAINGGVGNIINWLLQQQVLNRLPGA